MYVNREVIERIPKCHLPTVALMLALFSKRSVPMDHGCPTLPLRMGAVMNSGSSLIPRLRRSRGSYSRSSLDATKGCARSLRWRSGGTGSPGPVASRPVQEILAFPEGRFLAGCPTVDFNGSVKQILLGEVHHCVRLPRVEMAAVETRNGTSTLTRWMRPIG